MAEINNFVNYNDITIISNCLKRIINNCRGSRKMRIQGYMNSIEERQDDFCDEFDTDRFEENLIQITALFTIYELREIVKIMSNDERKDHIYPLIRILKNLL